MTNERLTHISLFSGIGGMDLAAEWAGFENILQCEYAEFPRKILEKHWPAVPKVGDVHDLTSDEFYRLTGRRTATVLSGGFPCQPHSVAGKRKASCDERDLWPEMRRVIGEIQPRWVIAENVPGLLSSEDGRFFAGILKDFSEMGYDVSWGSVRASDIGAIHQRERIAIIAHANGIGLQRWLPEEKFKKAYEQLERICLYLLQRADEEYLSKSSFLGKYNGVPNRVDRTKALGNSIVPQLFYLFFKNIYDLESGMCHELKGCGG